MVVLPGLCGITLCFCCGAGISPVCDLPRNDLRLTVSSSKRAMTGPSRLGASVESKKATGNFQCRPTFVALLKTHESRAAKPSASGLGSSSALAGGRL